MEVNVRPVPIVLVSFSAGAKGCMNKVLQLVEGNSERRLTKDDYQLVRECICGQIYDSSPLDFTSDLRTQYLLHPSILKMSHPPRIVPWMVRGFVSGLDAFFLNKFEEQRAEYWQTLYSSVSMGPFLLLCSKDDDLAPYQIICSFAQRLRDLGGDIKLVKWNTSPHVAHYKYHEAEYKAAVSEFLAKVTIIYSSRQQLAKETRGKERVSNPRRTVINPDKSLAIEPADDFFLPSSMEFSETREANSSADEQNTSSVQLPSINPHGVLSQILFDVCVPRNVEGWDIKPGMSLNRRHNFTPGGRLNPMKFIRRSRL
ncbi:uncharacterized protein LOC109844670 isoform X2 [Asparagus officinalis]|uniref:uncharacterized protein LOC109844670 isoform X2 n=1 Tax=Asparagus officinalis TaxID=4686 RepID=UPI00098DF65A|nr:uncharacterized protein LOC109844670 isoform X2 [Asparagus officinalis]XP_020269378.1 uncharacterized protein LOC109844670 isoform X2 [Asparagus officinalis]